MSEPSTEHDSAAAAFGEVAAFAAVMDALAPESGDAAAGAPAGADAGAAGAAGAEGGQAAGGAAAPGTDPVGTAAPGTGAAGGPADTGAAAPTPGAPVAGAEAGGTDQPAAGAAGGDGAAAVPGAGDGAGADAAGGGTALVPAGWTVEHTTVVPQLGELSTKLEEKVTEEYLASSLKEVREEHGQYFEAIEKHPRLLVGTQVPAIGKDGYETIRDTADAREWQEAVKGLLIEEVKGRASRQMDENTGYLQTLHASIELFQKNVDLVPGTKGFDRDLADRFATLAKPYELRGDDGKLNGYSIPVQPIIDQLRTQLQTERASRPAAPATAPPVSAGAAAPPAQPAATPPADPPQAGIASKAGSSTESEDFSTLFGTIGLPNFTI